MLLDNDSKKHKYSNQHAQLLTRILVVCAPLEILLPAQALTMCLSAFGHTMMFRGKEYKC